MKERYVAHLNTDISRSTSIRDEECCAQAGTASGRRNPAKNMLQLVRIPAYTINIIVVELAYIKASKKCNPVGAVLHV